MKAKTMKPAIVTVDEIHAATQAVDKIRGSMNFLLPLTLEERQEYQHQRVQPNALRKLEAQVVAARQHPELLPPAFDMRGFERDTQLANALQKLVEEIDELRSQAKDTFLVTAGRALQAGAVVYGVIKVASGPVKELQWTVDKLARRGGRVRQTHSVEPAATAAPASKPVAPTTAQEDTTQAPAPVDPKRNAA